MTLAGGTWPSPTPQERAARACEAASPAAQVTLDWAMFWPPPPQKAFNLDTAGDVSERPAAPPGRLGWAAWCRK